ncbi:MAG TPA: hypothetical protein VEZ47_03645 [Gemmatirosa sp.]|nr:hypothetical protein [Gemmatirosa sp.]
MAHEDRAVAGDARHVGDARAVASGGAWLTYRYRFGGALAPDATGTMKAPSFLSAVRRILARGLAATVGSAPAYLRLRAAGEQEMLFRIGRTGEDDGAPLRVEVVPPDAYTFSDAQPPGGADDTPPA